MDGRTEGGNFEKGIFRNPILQTKSDAKRGRKNTRAFYTSHLSNEMSKSGGHSPRSNFQKSGGHPPPVAKKWGAFAPYSSPQRPHLEFQICGEVLRVSD